MNWTERFLKCDLCVVAEYLVGGEEALHQRLARKKTSFGDTRKYTERQKKIAEAGVVLSTACSPSRCLFTWRRDGQLNAENTHRQAGALERTKAGNLREMKRKEKWIEKALQQARISFGQRLFLCRKGGTPSRARSIRTLNCRCLAYVLTKDQYHSSAVILQPCTTTWALRLTN